MKFDSYEEMEEARNLHILECSNWNAGYDCMHTEDWDWKREECDHIIGNTCPQCVNC